jgi:hypothetical protein
LGFEKLKKNKFGAKSCIQENEEQLRVYRRPPRTKKIVHKQEMDPFHAWMHMRQALPVSPFDASDTVPGTITAGAPCIPQEPTQTSPT